MGIMHILCEAGYGSAYKVFACVGYMRQVHIHSNRTEPEKRPLEVNCMP